MRIMLLFVPLVCLVMPPVAAELVWEEDTQTFHTEIGQRSVEATFPFRNAGSGTVTITRISSDCACNVPALDKDVFAPGEHGQIDATFNIGSRVGRHSSRIVVRTDDGEAHVLTLILHIPEVVRLEPTIMSWRMEEPPEPQTLLIEAGTELPVHVESVTSTDERFGAELETKEEGRRYAVTVTPETTEQPLFATLRVDAVVGDDERQSHHAHARVIRAPRPAPYAPEQPASARESGEPSPAPDDGGAPIAATPRILSWRTGEGSTPKQMNIRVNTSEPIELTGVEGSNEAFLFLFETVEEGREYRVTVTPRDTSEPVRTALRFKGAPGSAPAALARVAGKPVP